LSCRVYLIRHGETIWNAEKRFQGHIDIPLSDKGIRQARALSHRLADKKITAVYSSDLMRAMETARHVAEPHGLEVLSLPALREINFGRWEGLTYKEIIKKDGEAITRWWKNPLGICIPGGEELSELQARIVPALKEIISEHKEERVAVICHGGTIRTLISSILNMDLNKYWKIRQDNASLNILDFTDWENGMLVSLNDCSHLPDSHS
jgi:alpha-ribazole phosphatase